MWSKVLFAKCLTVKNGLIYMSFTQSMLYQNLLRFYLKPTFLANDLLRT